METRAFGHAHYKCDFSDASHKRVLTNQRAYFYFPPLISETETFFELKALSSRNLKMTGEFQISSKEAMVHEEAVAEVSSSVGVLLHAIPMS